MGNLVERSDKLDDGLNCKEPAYTIYVNYAIFALIFLTVYFWIEVLKSLFLAQHNGGVPHKMLKIRGTFIFVVILTIVTIILILIFHPTLTNSSDTQTEEAEEVPEFAI